MTDPQPSPSAPVASRILALAEHRGAYLRLDVQGGDSMYGAPLRSLEWSLEE